MAFNTIRKLRELVFNIIKDQINNIINLQKGLINLVKNMIKGIKDKIDNFIEGIFDNIRKMQEAAEQMGVNVSECVDENEMKIKQIASKLFLDITQCITTKAMKAFEILDEAVKAIRDIILDVDEVEATFKNCTNIACYLKVGALASKLAVSIPLKATKLFLSTQQTIISITLQITACTGEKFFQLKDLVAPAINSITQCIADKIAEISSEDPLPETTSQSTDAPTVRYYYY